MNSTFVRPAALKPTLLGYLIAAGIVAVLALIPCVLTLLALWAAGINANQVLVYGICFLAVGSILWWIRQHLPQGFG